MAKYYYQDLQDIVDKINSIHSELDGLNVTLSNFQSSMDQMNTYLNQIVSNTTP